MYRDSFRDVFTFPIILLVFLPLLLGCVIVFVGLYYFSDDAFALFAMVMPSLRDYFTASFIPIGASGYLVLVLLYLFYFVVLLLFCGIVSLFLGILYAPIVISYVRARYYPSVSLLGQTSYRQLICQTGKSFLIFLVLFVLFIPLYFIPIVGFLILILLYFWYFKSSMIYEVATEILTKDELKALKQSYFKINLAIFPIFALSLIPVLGFALVVMQYILFTKFIFNFAIKSRS